MVKDNPSDPDWLSDETATCGSAVMCLDSLVAIAVDGADPDPADLAAKKGWYLDLRDHEQVVTSAITVFGTTTFSTHTPTIPVGGHMRVEPRHGAGLQRPLLECRQRGRRRTTTATSRSRAAACRRRRWRAWWSSTMAPSFRSSSARMGDSPLESSLPTPPTTGTQPKSLTYWFIEQ